MIRRSPHDRRFNRYAGPDSENPRADTAVRLAGAMLAGNKDVRLFLAGQGVLLLTSTDATSEST